MAFNIPKLVSVASPIIFGNEGDYKSVNKNDNGSCSVGRIQWHANRALSLCKRIINADVAAARRTISPKLYAEILNSKTVWTYRVLTNEEAAYISALLNSEAGIRIQDLQMKEDVEGYIKHIIGLGVTNRRAICFLADIENQGGVARPQQVIDLCGVGQPSEVNLTKAYHASLMHPVLKKYPTRRKKAYEALLKEFKTSTAATETKKRTHSVVFGDTLSAIAIKYNTTIEKIVVTNKTKYPTITPHYISVGWVLEIPN